MTPLAFRVVEWPVRASDRDAFTGLGWALVAFCALDVLATSGSGDANTKGRDLGWRPPGLRSPLGSAFALPFLLLLLPIRKGTRTRRLAESSIRLPSIPKGQLITS